ncbi:MAG TPA: SprT family zinc-dependent metalloprotease [Stellaceae bacterium]|nr:SprT family zinc-dependent metalloprotease [Stellaceae bacterium]
MNVAMPFRVSLSKAPRPVGKVPVRVRVSRRARRMALKIDAVGDAVELVLPPRTSLPRALNFLRSNRDWVESRLAALPPRIAFVEGEEVPLFGVPHRIRCVGRSSDHGPVWIEGRELRVTGHGPHVARRVRDFLKERARAELGRRARRLASQIGKSVGRVTVRDTTTRWGSCSANGNMAFSWRLIMAPEAVLSYVVAHEVGHLVEMNHGPRFWKLVERLVPDFERHRDWLNQNRAWLLRIG